MNRIALNEIQRIICRSAASTVLAAAALCGFCMSGSQPAHAAGIPVIDATNLTQNTLNTVSTLVQEAQQLEQYKKQLEQYSTQVEQWNDQQMNSRTLSQARWFWNDTQAILRQSRNIYSQLNSLGTNEYLNRLVGRTDIQNNPCVSGQGTCTPDQWQALLHSQRQQTYDRQQEITSWFNRQAALEQQFAATDSTLQRLKNSSQTAQGRLEAISYTNQLIAQLADQVAQLRDLQLEQIRIMKAQELARANETRVRQDIQTKRDYGSVEPVLNNLPGIRFPQQ